jgi:hypothetical protein
MNAFYSHPRKLKDKTGDFFSITAEVETSEVE